MKHGSEKRIAVMESALDLFVERGFHGAPTSLIAGRAGVGVGTIYRYFESKDALIHSIFEEVHRRFDRRVQDGFEEDRSLQERMTLMLGQLLAAFIDMPREFRFLEQYHYSPFAGNRCSEIPDKEQNALLNMISEGRDAGIFRDGPLPVLQAIALGSLISLAKEHIAGRLTIDSTVIDMATGACWNALLKA
jgi:AcrR family transcriptional regulator